ncbi:MAG: hypothetical protein ACOCZM_00850 [Bacillota bacterium]
MRTYIAIIISLLLIFTPVMTAAAQSPAEVDFVSHMQRLSDEEEDLSVFAPDTREKLKDITMLFNSREEASSSEQLYLPEFELPDSVSLSGESEEEGLSFQPLDKALLEASYREDREDTEFESETSLNLEYWMGNNTLLRAGFDQETQQWLKENGYHIDEDGYLTSPEGKVSHRKVEGEHALVEENRQSTNVGISYQTSDRMTLSADYTAGDLFNELDFSSTAFGVEYTDDLGEVRARYQIGLQEMERLMQTGLELDLKDRATLSASYRNVSIEELQERIESESFWDFGVDLSLNDISSLRLGYQLFDTSEYSGDNEEEDSQEEESSGSSIQAGLEMEF